MEEILDTTATNTTLPSAFDNAAFEAYLKSRVSASNLKSVTSVVLRLTNGMGVTHKNKPGEAFMRGRSIVPSDDLESIKAQACEWLPKELDKGNGWALKHPLQKLIEFKSHVLLGLPEAAPKKKRKHANDDPLDRIKALKTLLDDGAITMAEYEAKKAELLKKV